MYLITPYKSIGGLNLNTTSTHIETILGKCELMSNLYAPDYLTGVYVGGITVSYKNNLSCYIGVLVSLLPTHLDFNFGDKSYHEIMSYFKKYSGNIYTEGKDISIISEHLGISTYFEDGLKEVGIFSKDYGAEVFRNLEIDNK